MFVYAMYNLCLYIYTHSYIHIYVICIGACPSAWGVTISSSTGIVYGACYGDNSIRAWQYGIKGVQQPQSYILTSTCGEALAVSVYDYTSTQSYVYAGCADTGTVIKFNTHISCQTQTGICMCVYMYVYIKFMYCAYVHTHTLYIHIYHSTINVTCT